jgi:hypothetical protein
MDMKPQTVILKAGVEIVIATRAACWTISSKRTSA